MHKFFFLLLQQIWNIEQEKDREKGKVGGRPAKLNEKKGDRGLEREIKNKADIFLLEEQHENFVATVTKWEMPVATNARWKWAGSEKKVEREHVRHFLLHKTCNQEVSGSFTL